MAVSTPKTKTVALQGKSPTRAKFVLIDKPVRQVSMFKYLEYYTNLISLSDINMKLSSFQYCGTVKRMQV
jgi:hypothetical protein